MFQRFETIQRELDAWYERGPQSSTISARAVALAVASPVLVVAVVVGLTIDTVATATAVTAIAFMLGCAVVIYRSVPDGTDRNGISRREALIGFALLLVPVLASYAVGFLAFGLRFGFTEAWLGGEKALPFGIVAAVMGSTGYLAGRLMATESSE